MGTMIQAKQLIAEDFGGEEYEGCNEYLTITAPDVIGDIHRAYLQAGADVIETNTFGATSIVLDEYGLGHLAEEINFKVPDWRNKRRINFPRRNGRGLLPVQWDQRQKRYLLRAEQPLTS